MPKQFTHEEFLLIMAKERPDITILGTYINSETKLKARHNCGYSWDVSPVSLRASKSCPKCGNSLKKTNEQFCKELKDINPNIKVVGEYISNLKKIPVKCLVCEEEFDGVPSNLLRGHGCPYCTGKKVSKKNCVFTTHPHMVKYIKNPDDGYTHTANSHAHIDFICPDCGNVRNLELKSVVSQGFSCTICSDSVSYPNKFIRALLKQLPVDNMKCEYNPSWALSYFYDTYFEYNNNKYIVEMDGAFHYKDHPAFNHKAKDTQYIDKKKDMLAIKNNVHIIRINSIVSDFEFIKTNILNSELSQIFDLDRIDWDLCERYKMTTRIKEICDFYQQNKYEYNVTRLSQHFGTNTKTISRYLQIGEKVGWITENNDELLRAYQTRNPKSVAIDVYSQNNNELLYQFNSANLCGNYLSKITNEKYSSSTILKYLHESNGNSVKYKGFIFNLHETKK